MSKNAEKIELCTKLSTLSTKIGNPQVVNKTCGFLLSDILLIT